MLLANTYLEIKYQNEIYKLEDELLKLENIDLIFKPMEFNNKYLNILYDDFNFQFQIARINLIKSIPIIQSDADMNWNNTNAYVLIPEYIIKQINAMNKIKI